MTTFLLNPLSACGQFASPQQLNSALDKIIDCLKIIERGIASGAVVLIYDGAIESRCLLNGSASIRQCLSRSDRDLRNQWYIYTKNRAQLARSALVDVEISAGEFSIRGGVSSSFEIEPNLLNFGGTNILHGSTALVSMPGQAYVAKCAFDSDGLWLLLPRYHRSDKHRQEEYMAGGVRVAPMTLSDVDAQNCLLNSIDVGRDRFGRMGNIFIRFKLTSADANSGLFHGFEVERDDIPDDALAWLGMF